ncbi:MAG: 4Fe-4S dicluster domain-containing protein [Tannerellaceae bacterium]|nr:4Fe-4S dicluster domain-containing protein [Tannerellaceae bacterium]
MNTNENDFNMKEDIKPPGQQAVRIDPQKCGACGRCIKACPNGVIGKTGGMWKRHIILLHPGRCSNCGKCIEACRRGVFSPAEGGEA